MTQHGMIAHNTYHSLDFLHKRAMKHLRLGKERINSGKISLGIITLYDMLISSMNWFMTNPENRDRIHIRDGEDVNNDKVVFNILARCGIIGRGLNFDVFHDVVDEALKKDMSDFDFAHTMKEVEHVIGSLGMMTHTENGSSGTLSYRRP